MGLLEAFSAQPYGFNDSDVRSLNLLAELILAAMKPEEENRLAEISQRLVAEATVESPSDRVQSKTLLHTGRGLRRQLHRPRVEEPQILPRLFQEFGKKQKSASARCHWLLLIVRWPWR